MKKLAYIFISILSYTSIAQDNWCGTDAKLELAYETNPNLEQSITEHMTRLHEGGLAVDRSDSIIIPVVFHILHDDENGNISHAQIVDAMRMLNEDFNRLNADTVDTRNTVNAPFGSVAANTGMCFELAKIDPNGNCTNGVQRRNSAAGSYNGNDDSSKKFSGGGLDAWDRSKYFNIWVVNSIESSGTGTTLGYAQFPYFGSADTYGVIIRHDRVGSIGTAVSGDRTLTHELGHCFGLFHTFQDGCGSNNSDCSNQGDYCCDTPPVDQAHWSCLSTQNFCGQIPNNDFYGFDAYDQFENYMSYSPCQNMFSNDQANIMLFNFDQYSWLNNLGTASNLLATGVSLPATLCKAEFSANKKVICAGESISFSDLSFDNVTSRSWTFTGGSPGTSVDSTVNVLYNNPGTYAVSIDVSDGATNISETETNYIVVMPNNGFSLPIQEGFESIAFPDNDKFFSSESNGTDDWELSTSSAALGSKSIFYENYLKGNAGSSVSFESGTIDLSNLDPSEDLIFSFDYAYKKRTSDNLEWLKVFVSKDCGETWLQRKVLQGNILGSETTGININYVANTEDFETIELTNVSSSYYVSNFRYKFVFQSDGGNNIYIDNINLVGEASLSLTERDALSNIKMFPNPVTLELNVIVGGLEVNSYKIVNTHGQLILQSNQPQLNADQMLIIETSDLSKGIYYISFVSENGIKTEKFVKH